jgi:prolyl oligopeptidase
MSKLGIGPYDITWVEVTRQSRWALAGATPGPSDPAYFIGPLAKTMPGITRWRKIASADDKVINILVRGDQLYALTYDKATNYCIVVMDARSDTLAKAKDFVSESDLVLVDFAVGEDAMYVVALDRGFHRLFRVPWKTKIRQEVKLPFDGSIRRLIGVADRTGLVFSMEGWTRRIAWFQFDPATGVRELQISPPAASIGGVLAERATAISRDGAEIPLSIIHRTDYQLDGSAPALMSGYGSYGQTTNPSYNPFTLTWVKRGGVLAICHVRGGGARGKSWHLAGIKSQKENGVDDFIACADYLVKHGFTTPTRLTATGISAGGIVVGGAITKRPDLFQAAVLRVPVMNLVRFETTEVGPANAMEFGSVRVKSEFQSLLASDPYHRVRHGVDYPAVLLTAGVHDPRVPAWQPAKFAARLQAASGTRPTFLRVEYDAGHGRGSTQTQLEEEFADIYAFALWQAGVNVEQVQSRPSPSRTRD